MRTKGTLLVICLFTAVLLALPATMQAQFDFSTNDGTITLDAYNGSGGVVTIPGTYTGLPVTTLADAAFEYSSVTSVTIPNSVISIDDYVFEGCNKLTNAAIPDSVTSIGVGAFAGCGLTRVTIPNSVTNLGTSAFATCRSMTNVTIPTNITSIGENTFYNCSSLTSVIIPDNITSIGEEAFDGSGLTAITLSTNVTSLAEEAFQACTSLTNVIIPASVTSIGSFAFDYCTSLTAISVAASNPDFSSMNGVLFDKSQSTLILYPAGLAGPYTIPTGVSTIGLAAFDYCASLTSITIPDSVTSIGSDAFDYCTSLTTATIGNGVASIGGAAFEDCTSLTAVYFQGDAPSPGSDMFGDDSALATLYYAPGTTGWGTLYGGLPTELTSQISRVAVKNNEFGLTFVGSTNQVIVVEACTNLVNANWQPLQTNTLTGTSYIFTDPQSKNYPIRFYRVGTAP